MHRTLFTTIAGAAAGARIFFAVAASAGGSNLIANSDFEAGADGWQAKAGWPAAAIESESGKAKVSNLSTLKTTTFGAAAQCVHGIEPGAEYAFGVDAMVPAGQARDGAALTRLLFYPGDDCNGTTLSAPEGPQTASAGEWQRLTATFVAPATAQSALVLLISKKEQAHDGQLDTDAHVAYFDNLSLARKSSSQQQAPGWVVSVTFEDASAETARDESAAPLPPATGTGAGASDSSQNGMRFSALALGAAAWCFLAGAVTWRRSMQTS